MREERRTKNEERRTKKKERSRKSCERWWRRYLEQGGEVGGVSDDEGIDGGHVEGLSSVCPTFIKNGIMNNAE